MRLIQPLAAALVAIPTMAFAQAVNPPTAAAPPSTGAAAAPAPPAPVKVGLPVKDKNGKSIGKVTEVKTDASGKTVAMIRMGADEFGVNASTLAVDNGVATINATKADLDSMLAKGQ
jgi:hypothetical protein